MILVAGIGVDHLIIVTDQVGTGGLNPADITFPLRSTPLASAFLDTNGSMRFALRIWDRLTGRANPKLQVG